MNNSFKTNLCMVIGNPIGHSLSPLIHNHGYKKLGLENKYTYISCEVKSSEIENFIKGVRAMQIKGVSCTIPHKIAVMNYLDKIDDTAKKIGAVNTIVNEYGTLKGYNTDWLGIINPLEKVTSLKSKRVALIGAGGAARACVYGLVLKGSKVTIYNRTTDKSEEIAQEFGVTVGALDEIENIKDHDIIINATSIGLYPNIDETPVPIEYITKKHIVFDLIYNPYNTKLLTDAKIKGAQIIHGVEMFLEQGAAQFKLFTGFDAPIDTMREVLLQNLEQKKGSKKVKLCLPIIKTQKDEVIKIIDENLNSYDCFEIWLDYIDDLNMDFVKGLSQKLKNKAIFLFRRKNLENIKMSQGKREKIMDTLSKSESYLDIDIIQQKEVLNHIKNHNLKISTIISYHNYNETPSDKKLKDIVDIITKYDPEILKISTMCINNYDSLRLLKLLLDLKSEKIKYIISGMGENGKITKIYGAILGNEMTFAPLNLSDSSAPGQLTKSQLEALFRILNT